MRQACAIATVLGALVGEASPARAAATPLPPTPTPRAPIELPTAGAAPREAHPSAASAPSAASIHFAVARAAAFLARFPEAQLRFDAALMLSQIRRVFDSDDL